MFRRLALLLLHEHCSCVPAGPNMQENTIEQLQLWNTVSKDLSETGNGGRKLGGMSSTRDIEIKVSTISSTINDM
jgi:hypothetical protein